jgi:hypothetical protein
MSLEIFWALPDAKRVKSILNSYVCAITHMQDVKNEDYSFIFNANIDSR